MKLEFTENQLKAIEKPQVVYVDHPLVQHKLSILRDKDTSISEFRTLLKEISVLLAYEVTKNVPVEYYEVETPLEKMVGVTLNKTSPVVVPILRAGLAFEEAMLSVFPTAKVGHLGMYRDEESLKPVVYFDRMPPKLGEYKTIIVDPMLATGGSINMAVNYLREHGVKGTIAIMVLVAAPEGIDSVINNDSDVKIVTAAVDRELNEDGYILPGLGDAGDRIFGTE